ncbi:MAG TPA: DNA polymerase III subunit beta [Candidatus Saccharibacteria bacterium]|nr:DNA polymerase III subunit beta [Candidatus Saccharibacteria bacterium]
MKVTVTQENLNRALAAVSRVASTKTSLPILSNILLKTENNRLLLAATNLEIASSYYIGAKVVGEGTLTIPARLVSEFVNNLPKGNVDLKVEGSKLHISSGNYQSTINGVVADEFPALPTIEALSRLTLTTDLLKQAITQTVVTASHDDTRPVLTGVYCHSFEGKLYFAATDGYRLSERELGPIETEVNALIPASTLQEIARVIPEDCDEVELLFDESQVRFKMGDVEVTSRLIDGNFPDYRQLIPKKTDIVAKVSVAELARITKIASLFARESGGSITLHADETKGVISIHSVASQLGENTSETEADVSGDGSVTLNSRYLLEALGCIDAPEITFGFSGKLAPCVLHPLGSSTYQHIVMPLKS